MKRFFLCAALVLLPLAGCSADPAFEIHYTCQQDPAQCPDLHMTQEVQTLSVVQGGRLNIQLDRILKYGEKITAQLIQTHPAGITVHQDINLFVFTNGSVDNAHYIPQNTASYVAEIPAGQLNAAGFVQGSAQIQVVDHHLYDDQTISITAEVVLN